MLKTIGQAKPSNADDGEEDDNARFYLANPFKTVSNDTNADNSNADDSNANDDTNADDTNADNTNATTEEAANNGRIVGGDITGEDQYRFIVSLRKEELFKLH